MSTTRHHRRPDVAAPASSKLPSLTGLRFLAALSVFCFHVTLSHSPIPPNGPVNPVGDLSLAHGIEGVFDVNGYIGVSFFFVLSGFVLAWSHRPGSSRRAFWRRRMVKIYPNHLVVLGAAMLLFAGSAVQGTLNWLPNVLLLHTFFPQSDVNLSGNPPTWSLGAELLFYLSFPLIIVALRRLRTAGLWACGALMVAGVLAVQVVAQLWLPTSPKSAITPISDPQFWFGYLFPPSRMFEFVLGSVLALLVRQGSWPRRLNVRVAVVLMVAGYAAAQWVPFRYSFVAATIVPLGVLVAAFAHADVLGTPTGLRGRLAQWLGNVSFGFYLVQGVTIFYLRTLLGDGGWSPLAALGVVALFFVVSLAGGALLYHAVESPAMRRFATSRRSAASRGAVTGSRPADTPGVPDEQQRPVVTSGS